MKKEIIICDFCKEEIEDTTVPPYFQIREVRKGLSDETIKEKYSYDCCNDCFNQIKKLHDEN